MEKQSHTNPKENGQSMVEFALSAIVVILLLVAIMDFGRAFFTYLTLRDAAQEGALYGSICPDNFHEIRNRVRASSTRPVNLKDSTNLDIECYFIEPSSAPYSCQDTNVPEPGSTIKIRVIFNDFELTTPLIGTILGTDRWTIRAEVSDTILRKECVAQ